MFLVLIGERYRVDTVAVTVDFNAGRDVYDKIRNAIKDKEIGILGTCILYLLYGKN